MFNNFYLKCYVLRDNVDKCGRAGQVTDNNIIWRMRIAYWVTKATDIHSEYVIRVFFSVATMMKRTRPNVTFSYVAWLVFLGTAVGLKPVSSLDETDVLLVRTRQQSAAVFPKHFLLADPFWASKNNYRFFILLHVNIQGYSKLLSGF